MKWYERIVWVSKLLMIDDPHPSNFRERECPKFFVHVPKTIFLKNWSKSIHNYLSYLGHRSVLNSCTDNQLWIIGTNKLGTLFLPPPEPSSLLIISRKPSTNSQTILLIIAEPCHPSSNGWLSIDSLDTHWRTHCHWRVYDTALVTSTSPMVYGDFSM